MTLTALMGLVVALKAQYDFQESVQALCLNQYLLNEVMETQIPIRQARSTPVVQEFIYREVQGPTRIKVKTEVIRCEPVAPIERIPFRLKREGDTTSEADKKDSMWFFYSQYLGVTE